MVKICPTCKKFVPLSTTICPECGNTNLLVVSPPDATTPVNRQKKSKAPIIIALLAALVIVGVVAAGITHFFKSGFTFGKSYDFRYGNWGDNRDTIKKLDDELNWLTGSDVWEDDLLMGDTILYGYDAGFSYHMDNNSLKTGLYMIHPKSSGAAEYIKAYNTVKEGLSHEYGNAAMDDIMLLVDDSMVESRQSASALEHGYVAYFTIFETKTSDIMLTMDKDSTDKSLSIKIFYTSNTNYYDGKN